MHHKDGPPLQHWQADHSVVAELVGEHQGQQVAWHVAEEVPVALVYNGHNYVVMLASPLDLLDFAYGFSFSEGIIDCAADIIKVEIQERRQGIDLHIALSKPRLERFTVRKRRREMVGSSSCGLCGISGAEELFGAPKKISDTPVELEIDVVAKAVAEFQDKQPLKNLNRSVHGAAWAARDGNVNLVREDVGRHNALDKMIGALLQKGEVFSAGICLASSRASFEMVSKSVRAGIPALVCLSAPTAFAVRTANGANLTLVNWTDEGMVIF